MLLGVAAGLAMAQAPEPLPGKLSGRWTFMGPAGVFVNAFDVAFDGGGAPGPVSGKLTWKGVNCGALDEPIRGSWDGTELSFEAVLRPNANTLRVNGQCGSAPTKFSLKRKPGTGGFEGEARSETAVVTMVASP
jgi:hypothetical protein